MMYKDRHLYIYIDILLMITILALLVCAKHGLTLRKEYSPKRSKNEVIKFTMHTGKIREEKEVQ